jgi:hypothetical protein
MLKILELLLEGVESDEGGGLLLHDIERQAEEHPYQDECGHEHEFPEVGGHGGRVIEKAAPPWLSAHRGAYLPCRFKILKLAVRLTT